jgi:hypothetical protein
MEYLRKFPLIKSVVAILFAVALIILFLLTRGNPEPQPAPKLSPFKIGVVTGTRENSPEENRAAEDLSAKLSEDDTGVSLDIRFLPNLSVGNKRNLQLLKLSLKGAVESMVLDPMVKVILVMPAPEGTREAFFEGKKKRPDILFMAGNPLEDPGPLAMVADLVAAYDFNSQGYLLCQGARLMGASTLVSVDYKSNEKLIPNARRAASIRAACRELGVTHAGIIIDDLGTRKEEALNSPGEALGLGESSPPIEASGREAKAPEIPGVETEAAEIEALVEGEDAEREIGSGSPAAESAAGEDPLSTGEGEEPIGLGPEASEKTLVIPLSPSGDVRELIEEAFPGWLSMFGEKSLFFGGSEDISLELLEEVGDTGGYFLQNTFPSPYLGYPEVLRVGSSGDTGTGTAGGPGTGPSKGELLRDLDKASGSLGFKGRMATVREPSSYNIFLSLARTGMESKRTGSRPTTLLFSESLASYSSDEARVLVYKDFVTDREIPDYLLVSYLTEVLGTGFVSPAGVVPPEYETLRPPMFYDRTNFKMAVITAPAFSDQDGYLGALELLKAYGDADKDKDGWIRRLSYAREFSGNPGAVSDLIASLADDPMIKLITVNQGVPGTVDGFRRIRGLRPDIVLMASESHEETFDIVRAADLVTGTDYLRGYLIPYTAKKMGARKFVHMSFPRHLGLRPVVRRKDIMKAAAEDLGMEFIELSSTPDPQDENYGIQGAQNAIAKSFPDWIKEFGEDTAFFSTNDTHKTGLLRGILNAKAGFFVEGDIPSPLVGYPEVFGLDVEGVTDFRELTERLTEKAKEAGVLGRMGLYVYPMGFSETAGTLEFGRMVVQGEAALDDMAAFLAAYGKFTPGAVWQGSYHTDPVTGRPERKVFLVSQDTYVLGKGFMGVSEVEVPDKYRVIGTSLEGRK